VRNFSADRNGCFYGYSRGLSMWPVLIPGDVLRARPVPAAELLPGDVIVLDTDSEQPVVHRLLEASPSGGGMVRLTTGGDRSGMDPQREVDGEMTILRVEGVLRRGRWMVPGRRSAGILALLPSFIVRFHCRMVRRHSW